MKEYRIVVSINGEVMFRTEWTTNYDLAVSTLGELTKHMPNTYVIRSTSRILNDETEDMMNRYSQQHD